MSLKPASGQLKIRGVEKRFGDVRAVDGVDLDILAGDFVVFLGPSGCGKTTLLRMIAGFETVDAGTIKLDGRAIGSVPPNLRDVGMVFQNLALFPHLTVEQNIAFGLELQGSAKEEVTRSVSEMLDLVELTGLAQRYISQLSGGQKQRVALARALVLRPAVLLLDEPLSALDMKLRRQLQRELRQLQRRTRTTFVFVTHDQEEALSMADRVGVFNNGRLEQFGPPKDLYQNPATRFVAEFVGDANIRSGEQLGAFGIDVPGSETLIIRPEQCVLGDAAASAPARSKVRVSSVEFIGPLARLQLALEGAAEQWIALCPGGATNGLEVGSQTVLGFDPAQAARLRTVAQ